MFKTCSDFHQKLLIHTLNLKYPHSYMSYHDTGLGKHNTIAVCQWVVVETGTLAAVQMVQNNPVIHALKWTEHNISQYWRKNG